MRFMPLAALLAGLAAGPALAQTAAPAAGGSITSVPSGAVRAEQVIDRDVHSTDNVEIGEVDDLVIDLASGRVTAVVIDLDRRVESQASRVAVPMSRLRIVPGERRVTIDMAVAEIRALPAFSR